MCVEKTDWEKAVEFHGHICPGLATGYKVAEIALNKLNENRAEDEELVAIVENDSCSVDAIMLMTGCTIGKGNMVFRDTGKQVYTFTSRDSDKAFRISVNKGRLAEDSKMKELKQSVLDGRATVAEKEEYDRLRMEKIQTILTMSDEDFATIKEVNFVPPEKARLFTSIECSACGEYAMEPKTRNQNGKIVCLDCFNEYTRDIKV